MRGKTGLRLGVGSYSRRFAGLALLSSTEAGAYGRRTSTGLELGGESRVSAFNGDPNEVSPFLF